MWSAGSAQLKRVTRAGVWSAAGLVALLALRPAPAAAPVHVLALSDQARRYLGLQYASYNTEFLGCMIGDWNGAAVVVQRVAPADVDPAASTRSHVLPRGTCEAAGWTGTVGVIHSHPGGVNCFYYFPGTQVPSSDAQSFALQPYPIDAIMCGDSVVWIGRDLVQHALRLSERPTGSVRALKPGNRVREGSAP